MLDGHHLFQHRVRGHIRGDANSQLGAEVNSHFTCQIPFGRLDSLLADDISALVRLWVQLPTDTAGTHGPAISAGSLQRMLAGDLVFILSRCSFFLVQS